MRRRSLISFFIIAVILIISCSKHKIKKNAPLRDRFTKAVAMFNDEDYLDAKTQFRIITLSYQGSSLMDSAQFFLAECHFHLKEYILSASEYNKLAKMFPHSDLVDDAQYKAALCEYKLSPKYSLDQEATHKAIRAFQQFLEEFPTSERREDAAQKLKELRNKLAKKEYKAGEIYYKMSEYDAAVVYFQSVIDTYYDTEFAPMAIFMKGKSLYKSDSFDEATEIFQSFAEKYPQHKLTSKAKALLKSIAKKKAKLQTESKKKSQE